MHLLCNRINSFVRVFKGKAEQPILTRTANGAKKDLFCTCDSGVACCHSHLANKFDVRRRLLTGQVSLAAVNQIYVFDEDINGCKNLKIH